MNNSVIGIKEDETKKRYDGIENSVRPEMNWKRLGKRGVFSLR
jgi:hypothetical protein